jgi:hypothetical protein
MKNYWIKIGLGAFAIFGVGMVLIAAFRSTKAKIRNTFDTTDPISLPVAFVPFRLDGTKLGSLDKLVLLRDVPDQVSGVHIVVKLADSVTAERFKNCVFAIDDVEHLNDKSSFRCQYGDSASPSMTHFGYVFTSATDSVPLLLPEKAVTELRQLHFKLHGSNFSVTSEADSMREAVESRMDARSDSVDELRDQADELEDSASEAPAADRKRFQYSADSVRVIMRQTVDRMKQDEAELHSMEGEGADSATADRKRMADSIQRQVQRELRKGGVRVEAPPAKPVPPSSP